VSEGKVIQTLPLDDAIQEAAESYFGWIDPQRASLRPANRRQALDALYTHAQRLSDAFEAFAMALEDLDETSRSDILRTRHPQLSARALLEEMEEVVEQWRPKVHTTFRRFLGSLKTAIQNIPNDKVGRPPDRELRFFIRLLLPIYQCATGKKPGFSDAGGDFRPGPLHRFVSACLRPLVPSHCPEKPVSPDTDPEFECPCQQLHHTPGDFQKRLDKEKKIPSQCPAYWCKTQFRSALGSHIRTVLRDIKKTPVLNQAK
jgi:hypothetical protein